VNLQDDLGYTVLHHAVMSGDIEIIKLLLKRGVLDINETDDKGRTLLSHAVEHTSAKLVKMLLEEGAEPNLIAYEGWTPLWRA
ncbi:ankyrin repeat-containing domain protein, partial [Pyronema domesticum]